MYAEQAHLPDGVALHFGIIFHEDGCGEVVSASKDSITEGLKELTPNSLDFRILNLLVVHDRTERCDRIVLS
jgi:hypothetical protein